MTKPEMWKAEFERIWRKSITRPGADELFAWLESTDFFTAPASSKYHLAEEGGLCLHCIHVYDRLKMLLQMEYKDDIPYSEESIAIVSLNHDDCKADFYLPGWKNQKTYDPEKIAAADKWQVKHDAAGDFIWETVPNYQINEKFVFGHGEKSVYLVMQHMKLTDEEAQAIRFHMSGWADGEGKDAGKVFETNPLAFWLHVADEAASFIDERSDAE